MSAIAVVLGLCKLPPDLRWQHLIGAGILGGIGFTMSIFITNLALGSDELSISASKIAIFCASLIAGLAGVLWLRLCGSPVEENPPQST